jgi:hypothetical protein
MAHLNFESRLQILNEWRRGHLREYALRNAVCWKSDQPVTKEDIDFWYDAFDKKKIDPEDRDLLFYFNTLDKPEAMISRWNYWNEDVLGFHSDGRHVMTLVQNHGKSFTGLIDTYYDTNA